MTGTITKENNYSDLSSWKRPEGPPRVWRVFQGRKKNENNEIINFQIQEVPKELEFDVVEFILNFFITEEPISVDGGIYKDPLAVEEFRTTWRKIVSQGVSIVALASIDNSNFEISKPVIAGVNILSVETAKDQAAKPPIQFKTPAMKKVMGALSRLHKECDVFDIYDVDKCLGAAGLCVHRSFRGQNLGEELLRVRDDIGFAYQIPVSETTFTALASQILAHRLGYQVLIEKKYAELYNEEGKITFPTLTTGSIKLMAKKLY